MEVQERGSIISLMLSGAAIFKLSFRPPLHMKPSGGDWVLDRTKETAHPVHSTTPCTVSATAVAAGGTWEMSPCSSGRPPCERQARWFGYSWVHICVVLPANERAVSPPPRVRRAGEDLGCKHLGFMCRCGKERRHQRDCQPSLMHVQPSL